MMMIMLWFYYKYWLFTVFVVATIVVSIQSKLDIVNVNDSGDADAVIDVDNENDNDGEYDDGYSINTIYGKTSTIVFNPTGLLQYQLVFFAKNSEQGGEVKEGIDDISFNLIQSDTSSCSIDSGNDDTAFALWGSSIALSKYMLDIMPHQEMESDNSINSNNNKNLIHQFQGKQILELGCGGFAVPSLLGACYAGAKRVIATDYLSSILDHVQYHVAMNPCIRSTSSPMIETYHIDWEDIDSQMKLIEEYDINQSDVILAADVIYGISLVQPLVDTIERMLSLKRDSLLIIAIKDGRYGVQEFRQIIKRNFVETRIESFDNSFLPPIPKEIENNILLRNRYYGNFTIYTYRWKEHRLQ
mmetsp:Transcript_45556/g.51400  ORF Transcript_45556/g.51400 Transcript_45556/m.51400 type:complete len:358 (-) Transcript_45556:26-1099(-)